MGYTGHVEPDGDWQDRVDGPVRVRKLSVEQMDNNVYVVSCTHTGEALLVDAAARPARLREAVADGVTVVLVTHDPEVARLADRQLRLRDGRIETDSGAPDRRSAGESE